MPAPSGPVRARANRDSDTGTTGIVTGNGADTPSRAATTPTPTTEVAARWALVTSNWLRAVTASRSLARRERWSNGVVNAARPEVGCVGR